MKKNDILLILIPSFIFALAWIGFSIYHNVITSTISEPLAIQIIPIVPTFNTDVIDSLKNREQIIPIYELSIPVENVIVQASQSARPLIINTTPVAPTPNGTTTNSAQLTSTPEGSLVQ